MPPNCISNSRDIYCTLIPRANTQSCARYSKWWRWSRWPWWWIWLKRSVWCPCASYRHVCAPSVGVGCDGRCTGEFPSCPWRRENSGIRLRVMNGFSESKNEGARCLLFSVIFWLVWVGDSGLCLAHSLKLDTYKLEGLNLLLCFVYDR